MTEDAERGRQLAFTRSKGDGISEVWVMENFLPAAKDARSWNRPPG